MSKRINPSEQQLWHRTGYKLLKRRIDTLEDDWHIVFNSEKHGKIIIEVSQEPRRYVVSARGVVVVERRISDGVMQHLSKRMKISDHDMQKNTVIHSKNKKGIEVLPNIDFLPPIDIEVQASFVKPYPSVEFNEISSAIRAQFSANNHFLIFMDRSSVGFYDGWFEAQEIPPVTKQSTREN